MKGYGFKHLKRKEGLQFYLKGFSRGKSFGSLKYEVAETSIAMSESTGDPDNE